MYKFSSIARAQNKKALIRDIFNYDGLYEGSVTPKSQDFFLHSNGGEVMTVSFVRGMEWASEIDWLSEEVIEKIKEAFSPHNFEVSDVTIKHGLGFIRQWIQITFTDNGMEGAEIEYAK